MFVPCPAGESRDESRLRGPCGGARIRGAGGRSANHEARTALLYSAVLLLWFLPVLAMILDPGHLGAGPDLLSRWLPSLLTRP
jgi:hypothetical protein